MICGDCGSAFRRRTWNSTSPSKKIVWQCITYIQKGKDVCTAKSVDDKIFNALVDRIEVLEATHFVFVLKNGLRVES